MDIPIKNANIYFDPQTLEYIFAFENKINVKWVFTYLRDSVNDTNSDETDYYLREILNFNNKIAYIDLSKVIVSLGKEGRTLKYIRSILRENYKPLSTDEIAIIYEHYFPNKISSMLLRGLKYSYSSIRLQKKYQSLISEIETYPEIIDKAKSLLENIFSNQEIITSTPSITNQKTTIKFSSDITSEQFYSLIECSEEIQLISIGDKYKVWSDITYDTYKRYYTSSDTDDIQVLISLKTTKQNVLTLININYDSKTISLKDVGAIELNKQLVRLLVGMKSIKILETKDFIGNFNLYGVNYSPEIMSYAVINLYPMNIVLYTDEKDDPSIIRGKDSIYHVNSLGQFYDTPRYSDFSKNRSIVRFSLKIKSHTSKSQYTIPVNGVLTEKKPPKTSYLKVSFNHASSMKSVYLLRIYLSRLFYLYNKKKRTIVSMYKRLGFLVGKTELKESILTEKRITLLTNIFEDVYNIRPQGYSSSCELYRQPKIINKDEYDLIKDQDNRYKILTNNVGKTYYLYCDKDDKPDIHTPEGGYPCCFSSGEVPKKTKDKILSPGIITELPPVISLWISFFVRGNYYRMGPSIGGDNSFFSCIVDVVNSDASTSTNYTIEELKSDLLKSLESRGYILEKYKKKELLSVLDLKVGKIDPSILYLLIEDILGYPIFIFEKKKDQYNFEDVTSTKPFYTRPQKKGKSIIIFKYKKSGKARYELIVRGEEKSKKKESKSKRRSKRGVIITYLYDNKVTEKLYKAWYYQYSTDLIIFDPHQKLPIRYHNPYKNLDYYKIVKNISVEHKLQLIDDNKKIRAIISLIGDDKPWYLKIYTKPTTYHPDAGDIMELEQYQDLILDGYYPDPEYHQVINYFDYYPLSVARGILQDSGNVVGFWYYKNGISEGFYCPIKPVNINIINTVIPKKYQEKTNPPIFSPLDYVNDVERHLVLKTITHNILTLISYLFSISGLTVNNFSDYIIVSTKIGLDVDSYRIYDVRDLEMLNKEMIIIPKEKSEELLLSEFSRLEKIVPDILNNNKIVIYSDKMYQGVLYYLKQYEKNVINSKSLRYISFNRPDQRIFNNQNNLKTWLLSKEQYQIYTDLSEINNLLGPIIYHLPPDEFYLIQNSIDGSFYRAVNLALIWYKEHINIGFEAEEYSNIINGNNIIPETTILTLNKSGKLITRDSKTLLVLYHDGMFSAILPYKSSS